MAVETAGQAKAAAALNTDVRLVLTSLDDRLADAVGSSHIRLVCSARLLAQPKEYRIKKRQDLELLEAERAAPARC